MTPCNDTVTLWECGGQHVAEPECEECIERTYVAVDTLPSVGSLRASANDCDLNAMPAAAGTLRSVADALPGEGS